MIAWLLIFIIGVILTYAGYKIMCVGVGAVIISIFGSAITESSDKS